MHTPPAMDRLWELHKVLSTKIALDFCSCCCIPLMHKLTCNILTTTYKDRPSRNLHAYTKSGSLHNQTLLQGIRCITPVKYLLPWWSSSLTPRCLWDKRPIWRVLQQQHLLCKFALTERRTLSYLHLHFPFRKEYPQKMNYERKASKLCKLSAVLQYGKNDINANFIDSNMFWNLDECCVTTHLILNHFVHDWAWPFSVGTDFLRSLSHHDVSCKCPVGG